MEAQFVASSHSDRYAPLQSENGRLFVAYNSLGVSAIQRMQNEARFEAWFATRIGRPLERTSALPHDMTCAILEHMREQDRSIPLDLRSCTDFERAVLLKTREIPRGEVRTYGWIAQEIGTPRAAKDVGIALSQNPILDIIPCHRVVRSDGTLAGYAGGGVRAKRALLIREGYDPITR